HVGNAHHRRVRKHGSESALTVRHGVDDLEAGRREKPGEAVENRRMIVHDDAGRASAVVKGRDAHRPSSLRRGGVIDPPTFPRISPSPFPWMSAPRISYRADGRVDRTLPRRMLESQSPP